MPDEAFETLLERLHPAVAGVFRHLMVELRSARESVNLLTERVDAMKVNFDRTISAAHKLTDAAEAVVLVLNDNVARNRELSGQITNVLAQLDDANRKLAAQAAAAADAASKTGADVTAAPVIDNSASEQAANDLRDTQAQLDALSDEMETKADRIAAAVVAGTPAAKDGSAPAPGNTGVALQPGPGNAGGVASATLPGATVPPGTASNEQTAANLGNPEGVVGNAPGAGPDVVTGQDSGVPTAETDQASKVAPEVPPAAPPVRPPDNL